MVSLEELASQYPFLSFEDCQLLLALSESSQQTFIDNLSLAPIRALFEARLFKLDNLVYQYRNQLHVASISSWQANKLFARLSDGLTVIDLLRGKFPLESFYSLVRPFYQQRCELETFRLASSRQIRTITPLSLQPDNPLWQAIIRNSEVASEQATSSSDAEPSVHSIHSEHSGVESSLSLATSSLVSTISQQSRQAPEPVVSEGPQPPAEPRAEQESLVDYLERNAELAEYLYSLS